MSKPDLDVRYVAHLARLQLSPDEESEYGAQLGDVLAYFEKLKQLDVTRVDPTAHVVPVHNVTRPDSPQTCLSHQDATRNAPATTEGLFLVPKIVE